MPWIFWRSEQSSRVLLAVTGLLYFGGASSCLPTWRSV
jgi:hypothetical protein